MKTKMILVGVIAALLVLSIAFSGVALAAVNYELIAHSGTAKVQESYRMETMGGLPYEAERYDLEIYALNTANVSLSHTFDSSASIEAGTSIEYVQGNIVGGVHYDEGFRVDKIANPSNNNTYCYTGSANLKFNAAVLQAETITLVSSGDVIYEVGTTGIGSFKMTSLSSNSMGDVNGTWVKKYETTTVSARDSLFQFAGEFMDEIPEFPELPAGEMPMCPFAP